MLAYGRISEKREYGQSHKILCSVVEPVGFQPKQLECAGQSELNSVMPPVLRSVYHH